MPFLPISGFYASLLALLMIHLAYSVVKQRIKHKSGLGHEHDSLLIAGRNHANASEYIPIGLILLVLAELNGANFILLHACGLSLLLSRVAHAWGFKAGKGETHTGRYWGTLITWITIVALSLINLSYSWGYLI
ncbi:MAG: MAPEG family protein [Bermanella sp.]